MASTRNKNSNGDYILQQKSMKSHHDYGMYNNSQYGAAYNPAIPTLGITPSKMPASTFTSNSVDVESTLFGINSTNLVNPQPPATPFYNAIQYQSFFDTLPTIMPEPLYVEKSQRPFPVPE